MDESIQKDDPALFELLRREERRQEKTLNLIASENFAPRSVREVGASALTNKYTEGYPGKRYYAGCSVFDEIEELAQARACQLFSAAYANVQPHSGASANNALFQAVLDPNDKILGLALDHGGHLTHGMKKNASGIFYDASFYYLDPASFSIDMDEVERKAKEYRPQLIIAGWSAYTDEMDFARFREIADEVGAYLLVDMSHFSGLVAGGVYSNPVDHAHFVTSTTHKTLRGPRGGIILSGSDEFAAKINSAVFPGQQGGALGQTVAAKALAFHLALQPEWKVYAQDVVANASTLAQGLRQQGRRVISKEKTHLLLLDLQGESAKGAEEALERNAIVCNRNTIPFEERSPLDPSGLRFGSPALTTRGFARKEFIQVAGLIDRVLSGEDVKSEVEDLLRRFPLS
jgi:glycine hydroxymethyltransferase